MQTDSRRICGDFEDEGIAIEWNNFELDSDSASEWSPSLYPHSLELCLNLTGHGFLQSTESMLIFEPLTAFIHAPGDRIHRTYRKHGERHRFLTINFSPCFLREQLMVCKGALDACVREFMPSGRPVTFQGKRARLTAEHERLVYLLLRAQCAQGACQLRCKGIVLQLMADFLAEPCCNGGASCDRQKCLARERVRGVVAILQRDLAQPPGLDAIGHEVGCSPFYLSRTFSKEMGMTIPQCLRTLRMQYAAELLKSGRCNVTEAAMEVGYSSLSHFSRAFCKAIGCCPAEYFSQTSAKADATRSSLRSKSEQQDWEHGPQSGRVPNSQIDVLFESIR
jgi:AraC-like DNA-binding protein